MPQLDVSGWVPEAVAEQVARLEAVGAQPEVTVTIRWLSAAERGQAAQERADAAYCRNLRDAALKGANKVKAVR